MEVTATGSGIKVPVGEKTLGRLFNVLGDTIDGGEPAGEGGALVYPQRAAELRGAEPGRRDARDRYQGH